MEAIVEIHCHILPGVDDGPESVRETLEMLRMEAQQGVRKIIFTPHYREGYFETSRERIKTTFLEVQQEAKKLGFPVELFLGCELHRHADVLETLQRGALYRMADTSYVLLEFSENDSYSTIRNYTSGLLNYGYRPVLAHAERYEALRKAKTLQSLIAAGAYIQINAGSVLGRHGWRTKRFCRKLLNERCVHFIASDAHDTNVRPPCLGECARYLEKKLGVEESKRILRVNPEKMLKNEYI